MVKLKFNEDDKGNDIKIVIFMYSKDGEVVELDKFCDLVGQVEYWFNNFLDVMRSIVRYEMIEVVVIYEEKFRDQWLFDFFVQVVFCGIQIWWIIEVNIVFGRLEEGYENVLKDYNKKQIQQLNNLIILLLGKLISGDRQKIMIICIIDVYVRDVVVKLIVIKVDSFQVFVWLFQFRYRWDDNDKDCFVNICDVQFRYFYEYLGNILRFVIIFFIDRLVLIFQINWLKYFILNFFICICI